MFVKPFLNFQIKYYGFLIAFISLSILIFIILLCFPKIARKMPINYILLSVFTLSEAYIVSFICRSMESP